MVSILKNIFILLALCVTIGLGYYLYTQNKSALLEDGGVLSDNVELESAEFLRRLNQLEAVELNGDIFYDPRFSSLLVVSPEVVAQPIGKSLPFAVEEVN